MGEINPIEMQRRMINQLQQTGSFPTGLGILGNPLLASLLGTLKPSLLTTSEQAAPYMAWFKRRGWRQGERMPGIVKEDKPSSDQITKLSVIKYEQAISKCERLLKKKGLL